MPPLRVDRQRFLLLTSAIFVGACPTPVRKESISGAPEKVKDPAPKLSPPAPDEPRWSSTSDWWQMPYDPELCLPGGPGWSPGPVCASGGATCASGAGHPRPCAIEVKDACTKELDAACARLRDRLAPAVREHAAACLEYGTYACANGGQGPEFYAGRCGLLAAEDACADPSVVATCAKLTGTCAKWDASTCERTFSGLSPKGRAHVEACMLGSKCAIGPAECLGLR